MDRAINDHSQKSKNTPEKPDDKEDLWSRLWPSGNSNRDQSSDKNGQKKRPPIRFSIWYFISFFILLSFINSFFQSKPQTIEFSEFKQKITSNAIQRVELGQQYYTGFSLKSADLDNAARNDTPIQTYRTIPVDDPSFIPLLDSKGIEYYTRPASAGDMLGKFLVSWILPFGFILAFWWFLSSRMKGGGIGGVLSFGKNRASVISEGNTGVTFDDVAGADESKAELMEVVDFLKNPSKYEAIGGKIPKGVLLVGPPGTGKTLLAKAAAGEAGVPFFKISGAEFVEMFVGVGASRVRDLFKQAKERAPVIIFIDELDAIGKSRVQSAMGNDEREQTLNQLLVEMDGFDGRTGVIILGATNRPEVLDPALLRPGRFDRQILVDRPDKTGREAILRVHARDVKVESTVDFSEISGVTAGFSGADLANLVNEAALLAVRANRDKVTQQDFDEAIEKLMAGLQRKSRVMNKKEKEIVAYHETGHALIAALTPDADPVRKISIIPRGLGALGYTIQYPTEDRFLIREDELLGRIDVALGGRAAEELIFGKISNGASNDLSRATDIARKMITEFGMSDKFRNVYLGVNQSGQNGPDSPFYRKEYSEETQRYIDETIANIIESRYRRVLDTLSQNKETLIAISNHLYEVEVIEADEFSRMLNPPEQPLN